MVTKEAGRFVVLHVEGQEYILYKTVDDFCSIYDEDYKSDATEIPHKNLSLKFAWESNADKWNVFVNDVELSALPVAASTDGMNFIVLSAKISLNEKTISEGAREWDKDSL